MNFAYAFMKPYDKTTYTLETGLVQFEKHGSLKTPAWLDLEESQRPQVCKRSSFSFEKTEGRCSYAISTIGFPYMSLFILLGGWRSFTLRGEDWFSCTPLPPTLLRSTRHSRPHTSHSLIRPVPSREANDNGLFKAATIPSFHTGLEEL
mmetsp:Transcript_20591/g.56852  ORF Transcript_20591/g.56852 Transcript_20591/m.56852 type:complete len:149 (+) Transcript_20591:1933-2379(+)